MQCKIISGSNFDICYALTIRFVVIDVYLQSTKVQEYREVRCVKILRFHYTLLLF